MNYLTEEQKAEVGKLNYKLEPDEIRFIWEQADKRGIDRYDAVTAVKYCIDYMKEFKSIYDAYNIWSVDNYL